MHSPLWHDPPIPCLLSRQYLPPGQRNPMKLLRGSRMPPPRPLSGLPRRLRDSIDQEGLGRFLLRALSHPVYRAMEIQAEPIEASTPADQTILHLATEDDIPALVAFRPEYDPRELRRRMQAGERCFFSLVEGKVATCRWVATGSLLLRGLGLVLPLEDDEFTLYELFVATAHRRAGITAPEYNALKERLLNEGIHRLVAYVIPGRKPYSRAWGDHVATVRVLRLGPWRKWWAVARGQRAGYWRERFKGLRWSDAEARVI